MVRARPDGALTYTPPSVPTYGVTVEGVEDSRHVAAQDADGDAGVVQRQPATASLL